MTTAKSVVKNYAEACYESASVAGVLDIVRQDLLLIQEAIGENPGLGLRLNMPSLDKSRRSSIAESSFGGSVHPFTLRLILLLIQRGRTYLLPLLHQAVEAVFDERMGISDVVVTTAVEIDQEEKEKFNVFLGNRYGSQSRIKFAVNPGLVAGYRISTTEQSIDCSVRSGIEQLRKKLLRD